MGNFLFQWVYVLVLPDYRRIKVFYVITNDVNLSRHEQRIEPEV